MARLMLIGLDSISLELMENYTGPESTPHLVQLMKDGARGRALCSLPAYTPTNWAALATGAHPGATGASGWYRMVEGQRLSTFDRRALSSDTIWDACARQNLRSLAVQYPGSYPVFHPDHNDVLAPLDQGLVSYAIRAGRIFDSREEGGPAFQPASGREVELTLISEEDLRDASNRAARAKQVGATEDGAQAVAGRSDALSRGLEPMRVILRAEDTERAHIYPSKARDEELATIEKGRWSPYVRCSVPTPQGYKEGIFRFKLFELEPERGVLRLAVSEIYSLDMLASTPELSRKIYEEIGGFMEHSVFYRLLRQAMGTEGFPALLQETVEELSHQIDWIVKASRWMRENRGWDVYYIHWHFPDSVIHTYLPLADPSSPTYDESLADHAHLMFQRTFELCDRLVGGLLTLAEPETAVLAVADHGNRVTHHGGNVLRRLADRGLAVLDDQGRADPAKSLVVLRHADFRWQLDVNTTAGAVKPEEREKTVDRILEALLTWKNEETGENVVSLALRKRHAAILGLWGEEIGDVVFFYSDGYDWWASGNDPLLLPHGGAAHGPQLPTSETSFSSDLPFFILRGPGVSQGERWDEGRNGVATLVDLVATCCHIAKIEPPRDIAGAVRYRLFTARDPARGIDMRRQ